MPLLKLLTRFVLATVGIALVGSIVMVIELTRQDSPELTALATIAMCTILLSPFLSGGWLWWSGRSRRKGIQQAIDRETSDEARKDLLRRRFLERNRFLDSVDKHRVNLTRNLERARRRNDYDVIVSDTTVEVLEEFFASIGLDLELVQFAEASELVFEQLEFNKEQNRKAGFDPSNIPFDGHSFERWVAESLELFGWQAQVTAGSGDQGIDVIAVRDGRKLGLQCKLYSQPVGNKAVQEAHAGKVFYCLDEVAVLTNASFTSSARDLALATGVRLVSHDDIPQLFDMVFSAGSRN